MAYLFKQQFTITDLLPQTQTAPAVVILEPEFYLAKLAEKYLLADGLKVYYCVSPAELTEFLRQTSPAALLLNPHSYLEIKHAAKAIAGINQNFPALSIVTIAHNLEAADLRQLMSAGITSHINRQLSRPRDVADIIKTLINF